MKTLILLLLAAVFSCTDTSDQPVSLGLEGKWVDQLTLTDTLEFLKFEDGGTLMNLSRGREINNGHDLPKIGSGPYFYTLSGNSISLQYSLSSLWKPTDYYFQQNALQLKIGRFYESENSASILTFRKIK
ncbi:hypothetical protein [Algoriphagus sp.]|uniref:hypothetical protein n=1 Tax=Algoriphagus sp. TaxID=1872435 RepID=UPI00391B1661